MCLCMFTSELYSSYLPVLVKAVPSGTFTRGKFRSDASCRKCFLPHITSGRSDLIYGGMLIEKGNNYINISIHLCSLKEFLPKEYIKQRGAEKKIFQVCAF